MAPPSRPCPHPLRLQLSSLSLQRRELGHEAGGVSAAAGPKSGSGKAREPGEPRIRKDQICKWAVRKTDWLKFSDRLIGDCWRVQVASVHSDASGSVRRDLCSPLPPGELSLMVGGGSSGGRFPLFGEGCPSVLSYMDENGMEQEEGKSEVTCM